MNRGESFKRAIEKWQLLLNVRQNSIGNMSYRIKDWSGFETDTRYADVFIQFTLILNMIFSHFHEQQQQQQRQQRRKQLNWKAICFGFSLSQETFKITVHSRNIIVVKKNYQTLFLEKTLTVFRCLCLYLSV